MKFNLENTLPPGCHHIDVWKKEHPNTPLQDQLLRVYHKVWTVVFDGQDPEFLAFDRECREDSKSLERALKAKAEQRKLNILLSNQSRTHRRKAHRRVNFMVRTPFLESYESKSEKTRMQDNRKMDNFVLHFNREHELEQVRTWNDKLEPTNDFDQALLRFRRRIRRGLVLENGFLQEFYGNWPIMANRICDHLEEADVNQYAEFLAETLTK